MTTITITRDGKRHTLTLSSGEKTALRLLRMQGFALRKSDLYTPRRSGGWSEPLIDFRDTARLRMLGIRISSPQNPREERDRVFLGLDPLKTPARETRFFKSHPRCQAGIFADPRHVNRMLRAVFTTNCRYHLDD